MIFTRKSDVNNFVWVLIKTCSYRIFRQHFRIFLPLPNLKQGFGNQIAINLARH